MKIYYTAILIITISFLSLSANAQKGVQIALLKYNGGGDWYANPTSLTNLIKFCNENLKTSLVKDYATVEAGSPEIFNYPLVHMTGQIGRAHV